MLFPLPHFQWQVLRAVLRAEAAGGPPPLGRELRLTPTRKTKDGTFLDEMIEEGLLAPAGKPATPADGMADDPSQFRTRYKLTELGRHAAEYGEYDRPYTPAESPLVGKAAEIQETLAA